jgi:hypothetical protein
VSSEVETRLRNLRMASRKRLQDLDRLLQRQEAAEARQRETTALYEAERVFAEALPHHPINRLMTAEDAEALAALAARELGAEARILVTRQGSPGGACLGSPVDRARVISVNAASRRPLLVLHETSHIQRRHIEEPHGKEFTRRLVALVVWHSGAEVGRVFQRALEMAEVPSAGSAYRAAVMRQALRKVSA